MQTIEIASHQSRYENVDVLNMLDPDWLEHSQASRLIKMVADAKRDEEKASARESLVAA